MGSRYSVSSIGSKKFNKYGVRKFFRIREYFLLHLFGSHEFFVQPLSRISV